MSWVLVVFLAVIGTGDGTGGGGAISTVPFADELSCKAAASRLANNKFIGSQWSGGYANTWAVCVPSIQQPE